MNVDKQAEKTMNGRSHELRCGTIRVTVSQEPNRPGYQIALGQQLSEGDGWRDGYRINSFQLADLRATLRMARCWLNDQTPKTSFRAPRLAPEICDPSGPQRILKSKYAGQFVKWSNDPEGRWCVLPSEHPDIVAGLQTLARADADEGEQPLGWFYARTVNHSDKWCHEFWRPLRHNENWGDYGECYHWNLPGHAYAQSHLPVAGNWAPSSTGVHFTLGDVFVAQGAHCLFTFGEMQNALARHVQGDWGDVDAECQKENNLCLASGGSLQSYFLLEDGRALVIMTDGQKMTCLWTVSEALNYFIANR